MIKGKIDDMQTSKFVTLSTEQEIHGRIAFNNLELTNLLNVCINNSQVYEIFHKNLYDFRLQVILMVQKLISFYWILV